MATSTLHQIAQEIYEDEFIDHDDVSQASIKIWLRNNIGMLNLLIYTDYQIEDDAVTPALGAEEKAILRLMYLERYYNKLARSAIKGTLSTSVTEWLTIRDGDNVITRMNKNEVSKTLTRMEQDTANKRMDMVDKYNSYQSHPIQVNVTDGLI